MDVLGPATLPKDDNVNPYAFCVDVRGEWFIRRAR